MTDLATALRGAGRRRELFAAFQPQRDPSSDRIVGAEVLARWRHPELGLVPPVEFIAVAEEAGLINEVGETMVELGCSFAARIAGSGIQVAINVSALQLADGGFAERFAGIAADYGVPLEDLQIEVTESHPVDAVPGAVEQLTALRDSGVGIALDDFGTGYSSLKQLESLPFTELKIDQSLIRDDTDETWNRVGTLVVLARHRGLRIVAEGIETAEQYERVRDAGCDRAQGYLLGLPMLADDFLAFVEAHPRTELPRLSAPARRSLAAAGVRAVEDLEGWTRRDLLALHGVGPSAARALGFSLAERAAPATGR